MTNLEIIRNASLLNGVTEDVDTFAGWKRKGRQVKRGSTALFKTSIWKPTSKKKKSEDDAEEDGTGRLILVTAAFFGYSQTEIREDLMI